MWLRVCRVAVTTLRWRGWLMHSVWVCRHRQQRRFFLRQPHGGSRGTVAEIALVVEVADFVLRVKDETVGGSRWGQGVSSGSLETSKRWELRPDVAVVARRHIASVCGHKNSELRVNKKEYYILRFFYGKCLCYSDGISWKWGSPH